jgi:hypothetical protein
MSKVRRTQSAGDMGPVRQRVSVSYANGQVSSEKLTDQTSATCNGAGAETQSAGDMGPFCQRISVSYANGQVSSEKLNRSDARAQMGDLFHHDQKKKTAIAPGDE